jgi:hypothetical protein
VVRLQKLREAELKAQRQSSINRRLRRQIRKLRARMNRQIRRERVKCAGKCDRELPIYVGPEGNRVRNTETRYVTVMGDKQRNKKRWDAVDTPDRTSCFASLCLALPLAICRRTHTLCLPLPSGLMWKPPKLNKVYKFHKKVGRAIDKEHAKIKRISNAPLVERGQLI